MGSAPWKFAAWPLPDNVDEVVMVDEDAVLPCRPVASVLRAAFLFEEIRIAGTAPRLQEVPVLVELQHRGRRDTATRQLAVGPRMPERADRIAPSVLARFA